MSHFYPGSDDLEMALDEGAWAWDNTKWHVFYIIYWINADVAFHLFLFIYKNNNLNYPIFLNNHWDLIYKLNNMLILNITIFLCP
jgi:hypothetical protein